ncbi:MAG: hypothetical protein CMJ18_11635 [Phycisphaeraceae bacterium]|nr:hypothetical protein [Phycisphaeraceae bacterium]
MATGTANPMVTIDDPARLAGFVDECRADGRPIVDYGVAHEGVGHAPPLEHARLVQAGGIIEHYLRDMTVRVAAGMTIADLQAALGAHRQFLPVDADGDLTVGEVIQHHVYGPMRASYGSVRDLLLGLRYIDGQARDISAGGRTVKNVAGYDLTRFMVGGLGQFGLVHEATLRTYAIPKQVTLVELEMSSAPTLDASVRAWMITDAVPALAWLERREGSWIATVGYLGTPRSCEVQRACLQKLAAEGEGVNVRDARNESLEDYVRERTRGRSWRRSHAAVVKVVVAPKQTGAFCARIAERQTGLDGLSIEAQPIHGCVFLGGEAGEDEARGLDEDIRETLESTGGFRVWYRRPVPHIEPFHPEQPDWSMLARLKQSMDPDDLFNPGRLLGGRA